VLVVDDSAAMAETVARYLSSFAFTADWVTGGAEAIERAAVDPPDVVLTDLRMKDIDGLDLLDAMKRINPAAPVVIMTAFGAIDSAIEAMRRGAYHYLTKPFEMEVMRLLLEQACREASRRRAGWSESPQDKRPGSRAAEEPVDSRRLVGGSEAMAGLRRIIRRMAAVTNPVLLLGETGTGKELVARAIHGESPRAHAPFVAVKCAALPDSWLENQLLGPRGLVAEAEGGTLFLDEVGDMSLALQAKLLGELQPAGAPGAGPPDGSSWPDVRCLAATQRDPDALVREGRFREDLFFRLDVLRVRVPTLRERPQDIPALVDHFLERAAARLPGVSMVAFTAEASALLRGHAWPGNVRELENLIDRLSITARFPEVDVPEVMEALGATRAGGGVAGLLREPMTLAELKTRYIAAVLDNERGNKVRAAEILGVDLSTIYRHGKRKAE
jgi:two-component system response regulator HydG